MNASNAIGSKSYASKSVCTVAALCLGAQFTTLASAAPRDVVLVTIDVYYGDLNLDANSGAKTLLERITKAAFRACSNQMQAGPHIMMAEERVRIATCRHNAVRAAVVDVNHSQVTAAYEGSSAGQRLAKQ